MKIIQQNSILIVDDTPTNLKVLFELLSESGFKVSIAKSGESALEKVQEALPDLILLDVMMPGIDGFETCRRLKADPRTKDIPVIFMTVLSEVLDKVKGLKLGAVDYITKPIEQEEVLARITVHLELRKAQLRLVQEEKMSALGQLVAGVAHEINNPVNFIYGNLSHAQRDVDDLLKLLHLYQAYTPEPIPEIQTYSEEIDLDFLESDLPQLIHSMQVGAERILEIVRSLKIFSRLDRTKSQPVNLHELIDSTLMLLSSRLRSKSQHSDFRRPDIEVVKEYGELPFVESNAGQLSQVFMNLLTNAIDAINEKFENGENIQTIQTAQTQDFIPRIIIRTEITPDQLNAVIRIKDNGIGMTEDVRQRMFEQFFTTKPVGQGTGLGLSITRQIVVVKHGGTLEVNSTRGEGSEFVITLPVKFEHD
ncbi:sensor histidine kinase [Allocoleopsis sp.]|uniref:sensor histidine kinase n=1 Tax=Allocoleopsis sp. TaxID=3088169 RepID=UPI002FD292C0